MMTAMSLSRRLVALAGTVIAAALAVAVPCAADAAPRMPVVQAIAKADKPERPLPPRPTLSAKPVRL